ncbi:FAD-dependent oxidoreductase [Ohtaekwangia kribbensis]|jgi:2-polyprenyl-6-methoxyphenol hydroxylase-like FAD-dependent oxidoreductase|uniref:FAD-dependent oxidoreductase n=1 Tax=Ohtaekwangia kribbensis TaxID=688913 RepID=A0ABW3JZQ7_9BACT
MTVIIIGAGIGGLCLAQFLKKNGVNVQVFERDASPWDRKQGYRLHLDADGIDSIRESLSDNLFQLFELTSTHALPYTTILNTDLTLKRRIPIDEYSKTKHHIENGVAKHLNVNRATLREILLMGLEDICHYGAKFRHYESEGNTVTAYFEDGRFAKGDLLIGADGTSSVVRKQRAPEAQFMDSGARAIYGKFRLEDARRVLPQLCTADVFTAASDSRKLILGVGPVIFPVRPDLATQCLGIENVLHEQHDYVGCIVSGRKEFFGSDIENRNKTSDELQQMAIDLLHQWPGDAHLAPAAAEKGSFFYIQMNSSIPFALSSHPNVTLLGDAIHTMTPSLGRGANVALRDSILLGKEVINVVNGSKTLSESLRDYEAEMTEYGFGVVRYSAEMGTRLLGQNALPQFL